MMKRQHLFRSLLALGSALLTLLTPLAGWAADVKLSVTVTGGTVTLGGPIGARPGGRTYLPDGLVCDSPNGTRTCTFSVAAGSVGGAIGRLDPATEAVRWGGACEGVMRPGCALTVTADMEITAVIGKAVPLVLDTKPGGSIEVGDFKCLSRCEIKAAEGAPLTLVAKPDVGFEFLGWDAPLACARAANGAPLNPPVNPCVHTASRTQSNVQAKFGRSGGYAINMVVDSGALLVKESPSATTVLSECRALSGQKKQCQFRAKAQMALYLALELPPEPKPGEYRPGSIISWGGGCSGNGPSCALVADADKGVTVAVSPALRVTVKVPRLLGTVSGSLGGTCKDVCEFTMPLGSTVSMTALPSPGKRFMGWVGRSQVGPGPCNAEKSAVCTVTAQQPGAIELIPTFQ